MSSRRFKFPEFEDAFTVSPQILRLNSMEEVIQDIVSGTTKKLGRKDAVKKPNINKSSNVLDVPNKRVISGRKLEELRYEAEKKGISKFL